MSEPSRVYINPRHWELHDVNMRTIRWWLEMGHDVVFRQERDTPAVSGKREVRIPDSSGEKDSVGAEGSTVRCGSGWEVS
jgi:hypothetical protein